MTRMTARLMDAKGVTYPAGDILPWFADADFVTSATSLLQGQTASPRSSGVLLFTRQLHWVARAINANIIELTGNHLEDAKEYGVGRSLIADVP